MEDLRRSRTMGEPTGMFSARMSEAGPKRGDLCPSPSPERGPSDNSSSHNDSDGIVSSLTNDDSSRKPNANDGALPAESSEESLSSSSSDDQTKEKKPAAFSHASYQRGSLLEVSSRKRKAQPARPTPLVSAPTHASGNMTVTANGTYRDNSNEQPAKKLKSSREGSRRSSKKRKDLNLTTVEGQIAANPGMSEEDAKAAAKREYHRQNAALARVRNKEMVSQLKRTVSELTRKGAELERANDVLRSQLDILSKQNADLVKSRTARTTSALAAASAPSVDTSTTSRSLPSFANSVPSPLLTSPASDPSALLLLQLMSTLLQAPHGQVAYGTHSTPPQAQGVNMIEALFQGRVEMPTQSSPPISTRTSADPQLLAQMLVLLQGQQSQHVASAPKVPRTSSLSTSRSQATSEKDATTRVLSPSLSLAQGPSDGQRLEMLLALSSPSTSPLQQTTSILQHSTQPSLSSSLPTTVVQDPSTTQPLRSLVRSVSNATSTPSPTKTESPPTAGLSSLSTTSQSSADTTATSHDLQASQLMLLLRSLSQNNAGQEKQR